MIFMTFHILGIVIPTDELIFFRGVETTNQIKKGFTSPIWRRVGSVYLTKSNGNISVIYWGVDRTDLGSFWIIYVATPLRRHWRDVFSLSSSNGRTCQLHELPSGKQT